MKKYLILLIAIFICNVLNAKEYSSINEVLRNPVSYNIYNGKNTEKVFNAVRYIKNNYSKETLKAKNIYCTSKIDIYLENGLEVNDRDLYQIISETSKIYDLEEYLYGKLNGKLTLLIMDINGGHTGDKPYMQGYSILDGLNEIKNDDENIIFLDYINGWDNIESVVNTIAHELHHDDPLWCHRMYPGRDPRPFRWSGYYPDPPHDLCSGHQPELLHASELRRHRAGGARSAQSRHGRAGSQRRIRGRHRAFGAAAPVEKAGKAAGGLNGKQPFPRKNQAVQLHSFFEYGMINH